MYMGVILVTLVTPELLFCAPHVYGGDPSSDFLAIENDGCSPCIWG